MGVKFNDRKDVLELRKLEEILDEVDSGEIWNLIKIQILLSFYRKKIKKQPDFVFIKTAVKNVKIIGEKE